MIASINDVSRETTEALCEFHEDLLRWTKSINLISPQTKNDAWTRHIVDSAQLLSHVEGFPKTWCDLGSGGGLPGIVIGIVARDRQEDLSVTMIESDSRKAAFLKLMVKKFGLDAHVINSRIELADQQSADVVSARALAPLDVLLPLVLRHISPAGAALLPKGQNYLAELETLSLSWRYQVEIMDSITDPEACVLKFTNIESIC